MNKKHFTDEELKQRRLKSNEKRRRWLAYRSY
jgi:hypothetical protein